MKRERNKRANTILWSRAGDRQNFCANPDLWLFSLFSQVYPGKTHPQLGISQQPTYLIAKTWSMSQIMQRLLNSHLRTPHPARYIQDKLTQLGIAIAIAIAKTWSMSQVMQRPFSFSSKKSTPSQVYPRQTHPARYLSTTALPYSKDVINEPGHAETVQLLIEELHTQLTGQQRHVLDNCQANAPLRILE